MGLPVRERGPCAQEPLYLGQSACGHAQQFTGSHFNVCIAVAVEPCTQCGDLLSST